MLYHAFAVRLSPITPTESLVRGWWIPRYQKQRADDRPNQQPADGAYRLRLRAIMATDTASAGPAPDMRRPREALPAFHSKPVKLTRTRRDGPSPPAHVRVIGGAIDAKDRVYIARKLGMKLGKFVSSIERVSVRLSDTNGPKGGHDQKCQIKVVLGGLPSVVVNEVDSTLTRAIDRAIDAVAIAVRRRVQRRRLKPLHHRSSRMTA